MSKEPQVRDVWEYQGKQYYISSVDDKLITVWCKSNDEVIRRHKWVARSFKACFTYIGKSKVAIDDLFKTEKNNE